MAAKTRLRTPPSPIRFRRADSQSCIGKPLFEQRHAVVPPKQLAAKDEGRHTEDLIAIGLVETSMERVSAGTFEIRPIIRSRTAELRDEPLDLFRTIDLEPALEETTERLVRVTSKEISRPGRSAFVLNVLRRAASASTESAGGPRATGSTLTFG